MAELPGLDRKQVQWVERLTRNARGVADGRLVDALAVPMWMASDGGPRLGPVYRARSTAASALLMATCVTNPLLIAVTRASRRLREVLRLCAKGCLVLDCRRRVVMGIRFLVA